MGFGQAIKTCFRKYFVISGRAPRSEYWWFSLFLLLVGGTLSLIALIAGASAITSALTGGESSTDAAGLAVGAAVVGLMALIFFLAIIAPSITVLVRRFHDVGLSGWWVGGYWIANVAVGSTSGVSLGIDSSDGILGAASALGLILNLASIGIFVVTLLPSQSGTNKYGPNPLGAPSDFSSPPPPPGDYKQI
jgi:uncharacterized membrane protein YhaH (DUF805 family)